MLGQYGNKMIKPFAACNVFLKWGFSFRGLSSEEETWGPVDFCPGEVK